MTWLISKIVGNPVVLIVLLVGAFAVGATSGGGAAWWIQGLRVTAAKQETVKVQQEFTEFKQETTRIGQAAKDEQQALTDAHKNNLEQVKESHEQKVDAVRDGAVAKYRAAHGMRDNAAGSSGSGVRTNSVSLKVDDGAAEECVPDETLIRDAADDAEKLSAWQDWCRLNKCPVE